MPETPQLRTRAGPPPVGLPGGQLPRRRSCSGVRGRLAGFGSRLYLFKLFLIPKRAPELDIGPSGGPSYERRGSTTRSEEDQFNLKEDVQVPRLNLRSARGTAGAPLPAISCLGAFRTPAAAARG